jgi:hypothetical protein
MVVYPLHWMPVDQDVVFFCQGTHPSHHVDGSRDWHK